MMHRKVTYTQDEWFHIYASSDNPAIGPSPNGTAKIFMRNNPDHGPQDFVTVRKDDPDGYTPDENGAMQKMMHLLNDEMKADPVTVHDF